MPNIIEHPERPYIGIRRIITMTTFAVIADRIGEMVGWVHAYGGEVAGGPFFRYRSIDMPDRLDVEAGVPVTAPMEGEGDIFAATLPAGTYATVRHHGHPDGLMEVVTNLLAWGDDQGLKWDMSREGDTEHWGCRLEIYRTDPRVEPDMNNWDTDLEFRLA
ncbi:GyrI-like domain-containing protein [Nonomuraea rhizosphaerae]|uniref:GyrI-like domain-containing protein n=1 Tax=Nonomuraea rhizosphaerae TaxID=2665663 RepID=UPI001C5FFB30|nr:GyrI-like domain-containing protein [Nonomuraea rhizosphaerae]